MTAPAFTLLKRLSAPPDLHRPGESSAALAGAPKLEADLGPSLWTWVHGASVLDYGCGAGHECAALALHGAAHVYGLDIRHDTLRNAATLAHHFDCASRCTFLHALDDAPAIDALSGTIDLILSLDCFEHYSDPGAILRHMTRLLRPGGRIMIAFGPPWKHPYGGHTRYFTRLPWVHLLFPEPVVMAVRAQYRDDGARSYEQGGLNRITVAAFRSLLASLPLVVEHFRTIPVRRCSLLARLPWTREYFTSAVECRLRKPLSHAA